MGWWWQSDPQIPFLRTSNPTPDPTPTAANPPTTVPRSLADKPTLSRDQLAEADLKSFLSTLNDSSPPATPHSASPAPPPPSSSSPSPSPPPPGVDTPTPTSISPTALLPTTMSCTQAFDLAYHCQSLGGQFTSIYRHGTLRSCSEHWARWRFCMRAWSVPEGEAKREMIRGHYAERLEEVRRGRNSEEVWDVRGEGDRVVGAFARDPDEVVGEGEGG